MERREKTFGCDWRPCYIRYGYRGGHCDEGAEWYRGALEVCAGEKTARRTDVLFGAAHLARILDDHLVVQVLSEEALALCRLMGDKAGVCRALHYLMMAAAAREDYDAARPFVEERIVIAQETGNQELIIEALSARGLLARWHGEYSAARAFYEECLALVRSSSCEPVHLILIHGDLGLTLLLQGDHAGAQSCFRDGLMLLQEFEHHPLPDLMTFLEGMAGLAFALKRYERMVRLFGAAERLREFLHFPVPPMDRSRYKDIPAARMILGEEAFATVWAEGRAMTLEQAIAYTLEVEAT